MSRWYVVRTKPRAEETVLAHLRRQDFEAFLPRFLKTRRHARRVDRVARPLFPGYMFVFFDLEQARWRSIFGTVGSQGLVCNGERPAPVPEGVVEEIIARQDETGFVKLDPERAMARGQKIEVLDGPLAEARGIFECMDSKERVIVLLNLLGRQVRTRLPTGWIQATA